ncbi:hypothetical protein GCM10023211_00530 [Orbus sasakiae]|uniref:Uncharacterized protein n=2 Tax=Orbus sasakiae TaxID=1078475 RepID=A0ABP9MXX5_9GAMM
MVFYEYSVKALESIHDVQSYLESGKLDVKGKSLYHFATITRQLIYHANTC